MPDKSSITNNELVAEESIIEDPKVEVETSESEFTSTETNDLLDTSTETPVSEVAE